MQTKPCIGERKSTKQFVFYHNTRVCNIKYVLKPVAEKEERGKREMTLKKKFLKATFGFT